VGKLCNPLAGWLHPVIKARYQDSPGARVLQRAERPDQPPGGVRHRRGPARVQVLGRGAHAQLDVQNAFAAQGHRRPPGWILVAGFPDAAIHLEQLRAARTVRERTQVRTADFFLTLEQQGDGQGQLPERLPVRLDRTQTRYQVTFIVGDATRPDPAICNIRGERVMPPELQRLRRLDVVEVLQLQRPRAATFDPAIQDGRTTLQVDALRF